MKRWQFDKIRADLEKKMVLLAGPRQTGKTWLAKTLAKEFSNSVYLNYDHLPDRKIIQNEAWLDQTQFLILDELHKMPQWKNYLKGLYDTKLEKLRILVTGSARLEVFQQVGDSLAGRYFLHHLFPLSPSELKRIEEPYDFDYFLKRGPFPEPFIADSDIEAERWRNQYSQSLLREDVLNFDSIQNLRSIQLVFELLRHRVGSPISYQSIAEDTALSPNTVKKYIQILEALYIVFRITPYSKNIARSLLKEPKIYFFDTGLVVGNDGVKLENLVAQCLYKYIYERIDYYAEKMNLHYIRTKDGEEIDFALVKNDEIKKLIEVKYSDKSLSRVLKKFHSRYNFPSIQIVKELKQPFREGSIDVLKAQNFLEQDLC